MQQNSQLSGKDSIIIAIITIYRILILDCTIVGTARWSALKILIHFLLPTYSFIFRERCQWSVSVLGSTHYQRGILQLTHFLLPTYSFIFREPCQWSVVGVGLRSIPLLEENSTYPFPTSHLPIYLCSSVMMFLNCKSGVSCVYLGYGWYTERFERAVVRKCIRIAEDIHQATVL